MIDIKQVRSWLISWFLAALIYDERKIIEYVTAVLHMKCHFHGADDGSEFFGVVIDDDNGIVYLPYRGTDGYTPEGNIRSWVTDLRILPGRDGVANGFQDCGNAAFDRFKNYLYHVDEVVIEGHSKGGGVAPYEACLCVENLSHLQHVNVNVFAAPPTGDMTFYNRFAAHQETGKLSCTRYVLPGDPITSSVLRGPVPPLNGVDVGDLTILPKLIRYKIGPAGTVNHSCTLYNAAIAIMLGNDPKATFEEFQFVGLIHKLLVN
jgi:hypothetical protein